MLLQSKYKIEWDMDWKNIFYLILLAAFVYGRRRYI